MRFIGEKGSFERHQFAYEKDFEKQLYRFSKELFRGAHFVRWDPSLKCELTSEGVKPDSLIVNLEENEWWVVEVERGKNDKISDMDDQLGKLSRVNYTKHTKDIFSGLIKMGFKEKKAKNLAKVLSSTPPEFLLILDSENKKMIGKAKDRGFTSLVVHVYSNANDEFRLFVPEGHPLCNEKPPESPIVLEIIGPAKSVNIINGNWWFKFDIESPISRHEIITISDSEGAFETELCVKSSDSWLKLPSNRKSIVKLIKGNMRGILFEENKYAHYYLKLTYT